MLNHGKGAICLTAFSLACSVFAGAQAPPGGRQQRLVLKALDTDADGKLSAEEIHAAPQTLLTLDRNGDSQLTSDELQPRPENAGANADQLVQQLMQFDKNGDGALTADELPARLQPMLQRGDANHDGKLTRDEIRAMTGRQGMPMGTAADRREGPMRNDPLLVALDTDHDGVLSAAEIAAAPHSLLVLDKNGDGEIGADEMRPRQQTPAERVNHLLSEWDTNNDGKLSKAEAPDRLQQQFPSIDKNNDGFLDRDELLQFFSSPADQNNEHRGAPGPQANTPGEGH